MYSRLGSPNNDFRPRYASRGERIEGRAKAVRPLSAASSSPRVAMENSTLDMALIRSQTPNLSRHLDGRYLSLAKYTLDGEAGHPPLRRPRSNAPTERVQNRGKSLYSLGVILSTRTRRRLRSWRTRL